MKDENTFLFDTKPFENGLKRIGKNMTSLPKIASNATKKMSGSIVKGIGNLAIKAGLFALALKSIRGILNNMPEIGQALGIAKDVFFKNFLFPLRKMVFPYLQKLVDWLRNNRGQFVKWGQVVANVFASVAAQVKFVIGMGKKIVLAFKGFFEKTFGFAINNITEAMNILSFKFAVIMVFLQKSMEKLVARMEPALKQLSEIFSGLIKSISNFAIGLVKGLSKVDQKIDVFQKLESLLKSINEYLVEMSPLMVKLGEVIGQAVGEALGFVLTTLEGIFKVMTRFSKLFKGDMKFSDFIKNDVPLKRESLFEKYKTKKVDDAIIKKDGTVIRTNPQDNIIATKSDPSKAMGKSVSFGGITIDFTGMQIILQNGSQDEAVGVGNTIVDTIRRTLQQELESVGAY